MTMQTYTHTRKHIHRNRNNYIHPDASQTQHINILLVNISHEFNKPDVEENLLLYKLKSYFLLNVFFCFLQNFVPRISSK